MKFCLVLVVLFGIVSVVDSFMQSIAITGQLLCGDEPDVNTVVKLFEDDEGLLDRDDQLDKTVTDEQGRFSLNGYDGEVFSIAPDVRIFTSCDRDGKRTKVLWRKLTITIPKMFVTHGSKTPKRMFNMGSLQLAMQFHDTKNSATRLT